MKNKLSIITINFNNKIGLRKTIESVISQTFNDFEYIIIDGGSSDESVEVIIENKNKINYWVSEKDNGVYHAMNKGIALANGKYLLFLNSGDFLYDSTVLEKIFMNEHKADFLCGRCAISRKGEVIHITNPPEIHTFQTYFKGSINHQSTFIKKEMFLRFGLYREDFRYNSDWEFWIRTIILNNCSTEKINEIVCEYNLEGISSTENNSEAYKKEIFDVCSQPILQKFIPDYEYWSNEQKSLAPLYWLKSKKILYIPVLFLYRFALYFSKKR
ncbi:glycosyltransferase family 2 protein [Arcicella rigui]|uniref:Glycosyltransferase family 2 protein n=1 Tax=Arcicella rigui TaxID=797020 RepID=A0ABU5QEB2_9BACT|nr:glycosyltransferase family 2 protein [Arcicella rigui]MEA5141176.1 glycosyltransferase family 2 protein [Arcicella rigui]